MNTKSAAVIAASILVLGATWLYLTEVRPGQLRKECAAGFIRSDYPMADIKQAIELCVQAGGLNAVRAAARANSPKN